MKSVSIINSSVEIHPRIAIEENPLKESRIILGSFPPWHLIPNNVKQSESFNKVREIDFFYGSSRNLFWVWYKKYVDNEIEIMNKQNIIKSLERNNIGITDIILSCKRKEKSALDKHLTNRIYNHSFLRIPDQNQILKILCTSKGVMNDMLLSIDFLKNQPSIHFNLIKSNTLQIKVLQDIQGNPKLIKNPFLQILECNSGGIPSGPSLTWI